MTNEDVLQIAKCVLALNERICETGISLFTERQVAKFSIVVLEDFGLPTALAMVMPHVPYTWAAEVIKAFDK